MAGASIVGLRILDGRISFDAATPPAPTPTASQVYEVDTSYPVVVLNASGDDTRLSAMVDALVSAGWATDSVQTGPASETGFAETTIYFTDEQAESAARALADKLGALATQSDFYSAFASDEEGAKPPLVVVIGADVS